MFDENVFYGLLTKGKLKEAIRYLEGFEEKKSLLIRYMERFALENVDLDEDKASRVIACYHRYYRNVFWNEMENDKAEAMLCRELIRELNLNDNMDLDAVEDCAAKWYQDMGNDFLGGRTSGYYGPYIWKDTQIVCFDVELPLGMERYSIKMLDGFIEKGWLDYLSFGDVSTGGWAERDGMICCVRSSYDLDSETFRVSLLRHEAQHMQDLKKNPDMKAERLEYRAKLVELIYSEDRDLLVRFQNEADAGTASNAHGKAAMRIVDGIYAKAKTGDLTRKQVQIYAMELFVEDVRRGLNLASFIYAHLGRWRKRLLV